MGAILGVLSFVFHIPGPFMPISIALIVYLASYYIFRLVLKIMPDEVGGESQLYLKGIGGFFFCWLFTWVMLSSFTLL